ncbi:hypothetical protein SAMN05421776_1179 [Nocardia farcinica]|uniref:Uncharacterized protein n=1 Tax=Nocardia farcinica TaxID=37329 RepID=A0A0H5PB77_NOCFR|nr:hypothetical protein [Nocardia farcinica]AXK86575.1 XRE family transcriptional regulator [Nocardia farcinica]CRY79856.1 Uncharacterised protein [Nocardia farcinica]SIT33570.1 hypothetical protein SAMN05421776_1179 [Nocardia farcinica]
MGRQPILSLDEVEALLRAGFTQQEIADIKGVTRAAVSVALKRHGMTAREPGPRELGNKDFPFEVPVIFQQDPYQRLRDHGEYMFTKGKGMSEARIKRLRTFYRKLIENNWVVEYDPNLPPVEGVSSKGGWAYRPREEKDGNLIIRVNEYTTLTDYARTVYVLPDVVP